MAGDRDPEKADFTENDKKSSSGSTSSSSSGSTSNTSPPDTPPDANEAQNGVAALPRLQHLPHSAHPPRRGRGRPFVESSSRLGAIDEHSNSVAPDIPRRNPSRRLADFNYSAAKLFGFGGSHAKDKSVPPPGFYDTVTGPRGEKFTDVRKNRGDRPRKNRSRRKILLLALLAFLLIAIALGVGLGVGLTRRKKSSSNIDTSPDTSSPSTSDPDPFPIGTYSIPTYLTTTQTNCTTNSQTWTCYPYTSYTTSNPSASFSTLLWRITSSNPDTPTNSSLQISNTNPTFSYPFTNVSLTQSDAFDPRLAAYTFTFNYRKQVAPSADIFGDGSASRCYFNDTAVSVRMYADAEGAGGNIVGPPAGSTANANENWPYAIEYEERIGSAPECYRYQNGQESDPVQLASGTGDCVCGYRNYGLS